MIFQLEAPVGTMAILTDPIRRTATVLDIDRVAILSIVINSVSGVAQFALGFGGLETAGKFHLDPAHAGEIVHVTIDRRRDPAGFARFFADREGNPRRDFNENFFAELAEAVLLPAAYQISWGAPYPDIEVRHGGKTLFKGAPPAPAE